MRYPSCERCGNKEHRTAMFECTECDTLFCDHCLGEIDISQFRKEASSFGWDNFCPLCSDGGRIGKVGLIWNEGGDEDENKNENGDDDDETDDSSDSSDSSEKSDAPLIFSSDTSSTSNYAPSSATTSSVTTENKSNLGCISLIAYIVCGLCYIFFRLYPMHQSEKTSLDDYLPGEFILILLSLPLIVVVTIISFFLLIISAVTGN